MLGSSSRFTTVPRFWLNTMLYRLTLGLMGLDELHLRVLATSSEDLNVKRNAQKGTDGFTPLVELNSYI